MNKHEVKRLMETIIEIDTSREPAYGAPDRNGNKPGKGERWKTPREYAQDWIRRNFK